MVNLQSGSTQEESSSEDSFEDEPKNKINFISAELCDKPSFVKVWTKPKGLAKKGIEFEKRLAHRLSGTFLNFELIHGPWIRYVTDQGERFCQPDFVLISKESDKNFVLEAKLTIKPIAAKRKLINLYKPLVEAIWQKEFIPVQIAKHLKKGHIASALKELPNLNSYGVVHCPLV